MAGKHKQMSTPQKQMVITLSNDVVNQRRIAEILGVSQSGVSKFLKRFRNRGDSENKRRSEVEGRGKPMSVVIGNFYVV